jgi:hemolysin III
VDAGRTFPRQPFLGVSHAAGAAGAVVALAVMLASAHDARGRIAAAVFGGTLTLAYAASAAVHSLHVSRRWFLRLESLDYAAIYLLIAGTTTPLGLVTLADTAWGWALLAVQWPVAVAGFLAEATQWRRHERYRTASYVALAAALLLAIVPIASRLPGPGLALLLGGGGLYLVGGLVFHFDRPRLWPGADAAHGLWHLFALAGSACHVAMTAAYVLPR